MIEIQTRLAARNIKQYRWVCTGCGKRGRWVPGAAEALDQGAAHLGAVHPPGRPGPTGGDD